MSDTTTPDAGETLANYDPPQLETLTIDVLPRKIAVMTINRPDRMNSNTVRMFTEFGLVADALRDTDARALIVRGAGDKVFCAGFDLDEIGVITTMGVRGFLKFQETATGGIQAIRFLPFPVIAVIHGPATGGGLALALAADIRLGDPKAKLSAAFVKVGLSAGELGTSYNLSRLIGPARAAEICFTARMVGAEEAERIGLLNHVHPTETIMDEAVALARRISSNSPGGVRLSKTAMQRNTENVSYAAALELENRGQALMTRTRDMPEALNAFLEKREPNFVGE